ncbi:MAG: WD40 repeat domain-containing protein [Anaerolineae bacterium]|nr:WD40 repeat domain-containing protein [Anaerolineae bacterium]
MLTQPNLLPESWHIMRLAILLIAISLALLNIERILSQPDSQIVYIAWHPSEETLAFVTFSSQGDEKVEIYNRSLALLASIQIGSSENIGAVAWNASGIQLGISTYEDYGIARVYIWDVTLTQSAATATLRYTFQEESTDYPFVEWHPITPHYLAVPLGRDVFFWNTATGEPISEFTSFQTYESPNHIYDVEWHPNGIYLATGSRFQTIDIWDVTDNPTRLVETLSVENGVFALAWSSSGEQLAFIDGKNVEIWQQATNPQNYELIQTLTNQSDILRLDWNGSYLLTWDIERIIHIWNTETWEVEVTINQNYPSIGLYAFALSPNGKKLAYINSNGNLQIIPL